MELINFNKTLFIILAVVIAFILLGTAFFSIIVYFKTRKYREFKHLQKFKLKPIIHNILYWAITALLLILLAVMILRPVYDKEQTGAKLGNTDIYILIDISPSMAVTDVNYNNEKISRLKAVKNYLSELIKNSSGSKYSMVTFGHTANSELPLTTDINSVITAIDTLKVVPYYYSKGTNIKTGFVQISKHIESAKNETNRPKILLVFTDGEATSEEDQSSLFGSDTNSISNNNVFVVTVGVGSEIGDKVPTDPEGAPNPYSNQVSYIWYGSGYVVSKLNSASLKSIAEGFKGRYSELSTYTGSDSLTAAIQSAIQTSTIITESSEFVYKDLYFYLIPPMVILFVLVYKLKLNPLRKLA